MNSTADTNNKTPKEGKKKNKRTYEEQKERIKAYIKNRYATDEEYRNKQNNARVIRNNLRYNTDEEYRQKRMEYSRNYQRRKAEQKKLSTLNTLVLN